VNPIEPDRIEALKMERGQWIYAAMTDSQPALIGQIAWLVVLLAVCVMLLWAARHIDRREKGRHGCRIRRRRRSW
jgi:ABC-type Fe3+ transport system permease subunit